MVTMVAVAVLVVPVGLNTTVSFTDFPAARVNEPPGEIAKTPGLLLVTVPIRGPAPFFPAFLMVKVFFDVLVLPIPVAASVSEEGALRMAPFGTGVGVGVIVGVGVAVLVGVDVTTAVCVGVGVRVAVLVGVGAMVAVRVGVGVIVGVGVPKFVEVEVGVGVGVTEGVIGVTPSPNAPRPCVPTKTVPVEFCAIS